MRVRWNSMTVAAAMVAWSAAAWAGGKVYVANEEADTVSVIDAASFKVLVSVPVGSMPHNVQVSPYGKLAWVTNSGKRDVGVHAGMSGKEHEMMEDKGEVWAIDTTTDAVVARIPVGEHPAHVVLTPDGRYAYVTNGGEDSVSVIDTSARRMATSIPVGKYPHGLRISPDGTQAYVANLKGGNVSVIDIGSRKEVGRISVGKGPAQVGFTPDGRWAFVSLSEENAVAVIDPATRRVTRKIAVGSVPIQLYATPDSRMLVVANQGTRRRPGNSVSMIDIESSKVVKTVQTEPGTHGVVVDREGRYA